MKNYLMIAPFALLPLCTLAAEKHVHGEAELFIALQGKQVLLELESPADNILGFEYQPSSEKEKSLLKNSLETLSKYTSLVALKQGGCEQTKVNIESPFETHHGDEHNDEHHSSHDKDHHDKHSEEHHGSHEHHDEHDEKHHDSHDHHDEHDEKHHDSHGEDNHSEAVHSSFHINYTLTCDDTDAIKNLDITAFQSFKGFENIQVNWIKGDKQGSQKVTAKQTSVGLK